MLKPDTAALLEALAHERPPARPSGFVVIVAIDPVLERIWPVPPCRWDSLSPLEVYGNLERDDP